VPPIKTKINEREGPITNVPIQAIKHPAQNRILLFFFLEFLQQPIADAQPVKKIRMEVLPDNIVKNSAISYTW
ncbi:MAG: hypothetical protein GY870_04580, partial [archaeon]|nr:hypothetical protein [archaeon]